MLFHDFFFAVVLFFVRFTEASSRSPFVQTALLSCCCSFCTGYLCLEYFTQCMTEYSSMTSFSLVLNYLAGSY